MRKVAPIVFLTILLLACNRNPDETKLHQDATPLSASSETTSDRNATSQAVTGPAVVLNGFSLGMDIRDVPATMMMLLADRGLSGFGFTGDIQLSNGGHCILMYTKAFMAAIEARARDRFGAARAPAKIDEEIQLSCVNSDGVMSAHSGADGKVDRIQFNDARNLFGSKDETPEAFSHRLVDEYHVPPMQPDEDRTTWLAVDGQGRSFSLHTRSPLGVPMLQLVLSRTGS